jgi:U3 small nucleolar RNA-associated protein MPP10
MGEATSRSRPINSLLEEDLEFDRTMKAVPVVTEDSVQTLEDVIKKRILDVSTRTLVLLAILLHFY